MENLISQLKLLREHDEKEFKYHLRNLLKKKQVEGAKAFSFIVSEFKKEIFYDSFFFIDILNETIFYFFLEEKEPFELIMELIHVAGPIGNKDTQDVLKQILKKHPQHSPFYLGLMNYYGELSHKISFLEQKIGDFKLHAPKSMIVEWHE